MTDRNRSKPVSSILYDSAPSSRQTVKFMTATTIGGALLLLSGIILTGTVLALVMATPLLLLFSPILVPAGILMLLVTSGFVFSGGFGVAALSALTWIYNYVSGKHPVGADQLDHARMVLMGRAKEMGQFVQNKAHEVTQGA